LALPINPALRNTSGGGTLLVNPAILRDLNIAESPGNSRDPPLLRPVGAVVAMDEGAGGRPVRDLQRHAVVLPMIAVASGDSNGGRTPPPLRPLPARRDLHGAMFATGGSAAVLGGTPTAAGGGVETLEGGTNRVIFAQRSLSPCLSHATINNTTGQNAAVLGLLNAGYDDYKIKGILSKPFVD
jgi:hypothetical protein